MKFRGPGAIRLGGNGAVSITDVILRVENHHKQAEAKVVAAGKSLFAQESGDDMYAAIDGLIDKIDKQVRRHKDRVRDHQATAVKKAVSLG
jgi:putative sigma-54 modulation protein